MNVASLSLCKELHELSGWDSPHLSGETVNGKRAYPRYDLGYLLRKLPPHSYVGQHGNSGYTSWNTDFAIKLQQPQLEFEATAGTPEDAVCRLAIELFKQGIL